MSHVSPANPFTASSVSAVPPSWEIATRTSASGALPEDELERLRGVPARERGMERRAAAGEEDARAGG